MTKPAGTSRSPRTERVLDPSFVEGLGDLSIDDLRSRRDQALAEREYLSYYRRLLQAWTDILEAERTRRLSGEVDARPLVDRLTAALSDGRKGPGRGEAVRLALPGGDLAEAERRANSLLGWEAPPDPEDLSEADLEAALAGLDHEERAVSSDRAAIIRVVDTLQGELTRRYREDPTQALQGF